CTRLFFACHDTYYNITNSNPLVEAEWCIAIVTFTINACKFSFGIESINFVSILHSSAGLSIGVV
ncbi:hypothetical protein, partial [Treponema sp.]|uniref:hypothetical protein n=1 Tax=Treponema sp. TaxID=166 RepID=UPI00298E70C7